MDFAAKLRVLSACSTGLLLGMCGCQGLKNGPTNNNGLQSINHIIFMVQENRSFDTYFGQLPAYWQANGFPAQQFEGLPPNASNPSFDEPLRFRPITWRRNALRISAHRGMRAMSTGTVPARLRVLQPWTVLSTTRLSMP